MKWVRGRLGTGYDKLSLFQSRRLMCDAWLLRSKEGVEIPPHVDVVPGYRHYRINVILKAATGGGVFSADYALVNLARLKVFRSDRLHAVSPIASGSRLVLSIGICLKD
jgi:hypothetical protein